MSLIEEIKRNFPNSENEAKAKIEDTLKKVSIDFARELHKKVKKSILNRVECYDFKEISGRKVIQDQIEHIYCYGSHSLDKTIVNLFNNQKQLFESFDNIQYIRLNDREIWFPPIFSNTKYKFNFLSNKKRHVEFEITQWGNLFFEEFERLCTEDGIDFKFKVVYSFLYNSEDQFSMECTVNIDENFVQTSWYDEIKFEGKRAEYILSLTYEFIYD